MTGQSEAVVLLEVTQLFRYRSTAVVTDMYSLCLAVDDGFYVDVVCRPAIFDGPLYDWHGVGAIAAWPPLVMAALPALDGRAISFIEPTVGHLVAGSI